MENVRDEVEHSVEEAAYLAVGLGLLGVRQLRCLFRFATRLAGDTKRPFSR